MYDYGARWYDPAVGRFTTVDPLADQFPGWNPYHYVHNNPVRLTDPTGMSAEESDDWYLPEGGNELVYNENIKSQSDLDKNGISGKYIGESAARVDNNGNTVSYNSDGTTSDAVPMDDVTITNSRYSISEYKPGFFDKLRDNSLLGGITYDIANSISLTFQGLNPFDFEITHLGSGGMATSNERSMAMVDNVALALPFARSAQGVKAVVPKGVGWFSRLNAAKFSSTFKGSLSTLKPSTRGMLNRHLNRQVLDRVNNSLQSGSGIISTSKLLKKDK